MDQLAGPHDEADVVLDQADGQVPLCNELAQQLAEGGRLLLGLAGRRLIEE